MILSGGTTPAAALRPVAGEEPPVTIPRDPAREAAERELSDPVYHQNDPSLVERALDQLWEWISDLFTAASGATPGGALGLLALLLFVLLLAAALWWRLGTPHRSPTASPQLFDDRPRSAAEHRATAEAHAAAEHWSQAVQERMRAVVRSLEERALLDERPGRTADEAAAEAGRTLPAHAEQLREAARTFDDVTYGGRNADQSAYLHLAGLDQALEQTRPTLSSDALGAAG
ncbi:DUF4129 domain-containing protein [Streptomyces sp. KLOTTS4A1]|uniref:DUF4129 domain-containing protein n=1 Tax=Streptomyces sp. KLOTTS4A1 TaxID=3390996 RepID=UPI0039F4D31D